MRRFLLWSLPLSACALFAVPKESTCEQNGAFLGCDSDGSILRCTEVGEALIILHEPCGGGTFCSDAFQGCAEGSCGNGLIDAGEDCDGDNLNNQSCVGLGFPQGGELSCNDDCTINVDCIGESCGNGIDDDGDGLTDCAAAECAAEPVCTPGAACQDGTLEPGESCFFGFLSADTGDSPNSIVAIDLDLDGDLDLVTANQNDGTVSVLTNTISEGGPGFTTENFTAGAGVRVAAVGQVVSSAFPDIVTADEFDNSISILDNGGNNNFSNIQDLTPSVATAAPFSVVIADLDRDFGLDIVTANAGTSTLEVFLSIGNDQFSATLLNTGVRPESVTAGDFDGNGDLDLVSANFDTGTLDLFAGDGVGGFTLLDSLDANFSLTKVVLGNLDGDGAEEIVASNRNDGGIYISSGLAAPQFIATGAGAEGLALGDIDGDGDLDIVVGHFGAPSIGVLLNDGSGGFDIIQTIPLPTVGPADIALGDFNNDSFLDIATPIQGLNQVAVFFQEP